MKKYTSHNLGQNLIKSIFKAPRRILQLFSSYQSLIKVATFSFLTILFAVVTVQYAESRRVDSVNFGTHQILNIFPTQVETNDWAGVESVLIQELTGNALYQEFSARNSAYVPQTDLVVPPSLSSSPTVSNSDTDTPTETPQDEGVTTPYENGSLDAESENSELNNDDQVLENLDEQQDADEVIEEVIETEVEAQMPSEPEQTDSNSDEPVVFNFSPALSGLDVYKSAFGLFPLAQFSITATTETTLPLTDNEVSETLIEETITTNSEEILISNDSEGEVQPLRLDNIEEELNPEVVPDTTTQFLPPTLDETLIEELEVGVVDSLLTTYEITLSNFKTAPLEPGQLVNGMQLRMSFAGKLDKISSDKDPFVEVVFNDGTNDRVVGVILLDEEVSNAVNGGYYLFGLPALKHLDDLADFKVTVRYHGDKDDLQGMFLDAVWLELSTRIVTDKDLKDRGVAEQLKSLKKPEFNQLVSDKINFNRDESPIFNLRYASQRNALVRGIRNLTGQDLVSVEKVEVKHKSLGPLGITPKITVTRDGLLTIEISDEEIPKFRPGNYDVEITLNEGGVEFTDSFSFQWGVLSINPNKSEYEVGETAQISIGALTPNGNTICKANLDLFVTSPEGLISKILVDESGLCDGNNVIDVPDFMTSIPVNESGTYRLYLERLDEEGNVLGFTNDTFLATPDQKLSIERNGPTRIYPPSPYPMTLTVDASESFNGVLTERVPKDFVVTDTSADIRIDGDWQILTWDISILGVGTESVSYNFDAPDLSPYLYNLGPASLQGESRTREIEVSSTTASTTEIQTIVEGGALFAEHRQWQIASDAVGNMILFWTDGATIPTDWSCLSCGSGTFFERFAMGSSTYNTTGGALTHGHTVTGSVAQTTSGGVVENWSGTTISANDHSHTFTPTIGTASNLPSYRTLRVIQYTLSAGEPPTIPAGAVAVFDSSVPTGWTRYSAQDGYYLYGADTIGSTGGSNTHTHSITGTVTAAGGGTLGNRGGGTQVSAAAAGHTHTVSANSEVENNEPPYIEVILGEIDVTGAPPEGMISMWTEDVPPGWIDVSSDESAPFSGRFIKGSASYGTAGGSISHTQTNTVGLTTSVASASQDGRTGAFGSSNTHTHLVDVTDFSEVNHLPPYLTVVFGKRIGLDATLTQANYRWYQNINNQTPTTGWHVNLDENDPITQLTAPLIDEDVIRLRVNAEVANATSTVGAEVKLQFATSSVCTTADVWTDVGDIGSGSIWRGFNNTSVTDGSTLASTLLASSTVALTYEETGVSAVTPNEVPAGGFGEWDFVIQNNGADAGTGYCFRLVYEDNTPLFAYNVYPQLITNASPANHQLQKLFDNENTSDTIPTFDFFAVDPESDKIDYQVQIASDYGFTSVVIERDSVTHSAQFENQVLTSEKNPFTSGQVVRFLNNTSLTNGNTYWWRVRGSDPDGSDVWGDWSNQNSFTVSTSLVASGWLQREDEQFTRGVLSGVEVYGSDQVRLITGSTTGTIISPTIDFNQGEDGTAWDSLRFSNDTTNGSILYRIEYRNDANEWNLIPNADLAGNSTGFSSSPVSLLGLDVSTYRFIRIVATLNNIGGTPFLQEWAVDWGFRVETPTIASPFANEKVSTTTPTFTFTTTDPQGDDLTYQIEWSTDVTFTSGVVTRTSDPDVGFINLNDGANLDPFNSGDTILFTVQTADALTNGTTYWWRVRAKDTTGDDEYSFWTVSRSFTVDNTVTASTWFQTTQQQFESNILSGTTGVSGGVTVATVAEEALIVYGEGTVTTPRYRIWNGSVWGNESSLLDINSTIRSVVTRAGTTREEYVAATVGANGHVIAQVYSLGEWDNEQTMTTTVGSTATRGFDVAYETVSGRAMVVYCKGNTEPAYRIWNGSTWSAETVITESVLTSDCRWVQLASDPVSNEIIMALRGSDTAPHQALVWNGTAWGNSQTIGTARVAAYEGAAIEYEESGDQAIMVAATNGGGGNRFDYITWNGTTWTGPTTYNTGTIARQYWPKLTRNKGTDELVLCYVSDDSNVRALRWTGGGWASPAVLSTAVNNVADPAVSCVFENTSGRDNYILAAYSDTTATEYEVWDTTTWSNTNTQINSIVNTATMQLMRTDNDAILGTFFDYSNTSLRFSTWNGTSWSATETLEDDVSVTNSPYGYPYYMAPRNPGSEGTVVVSPPIVFTEGLGPYFEEFSWNETTPGASDIVYQLQYFNGTSWQFIPNSALSGNETGFTTGPIDLSGLNISTYGTIRPYATLSCDGSTNCPTLNDWTVTWAEGITISGTLQEYDQVTNVGAGTVAVAVNGVLQIGKTGSVSTGLWGVDNVTVFPGDIISVFLTGASDTNEAVGVTRYDGFGDIEGIALFERHLSLGSNDATTTPLTNVDIGLYDYTNTEDVFFRVTGSTLDLCVEDGCSLSNLYVKSGVHYTPGGRFISHDFENNGIFTSGSFTHEVAGSWVNNATTTMTGSTIVFSATSTTESITMTESFNNVTFGTTTGSGTWNLATALDVNGNLNVTRGTLARATTSITVAGALNNGANGFWTGIGTTTFDGNGASTWSDANSTLQNVGNIVVDGVSKITTLTGNVGAQSITIGANDTLDVSPTGFDITVYGGWLNQNNFIPRTGEVFFSATSTGQNITTAGDAFYDLTFNGIGGGWAFTESTLLVNNDFGVATGTVTLPTATTTIAGSFDATGGSFANNNGTLFFTSNSAETINFDGGLFTNVAYNLTFNGGGSWTISDTNATTTNDIIVTQGTVNFPSGVLAIGGTLVDNGGTFVGGSGTVLFYSSVSEIITAGGSSFNSLNFDGTGSWSFSDTNMNANGDLIVTNGTLTLPSGTFSIGGSYDNDSTVISGTGEVLFNSTDSGETVAFGSSPLYNVRFNGPTGGWTMIENATTTNNFTLTNASDWTLDSSQVLSVGNTFTNLVGGASTTWTGSTLSLESGSFNINNKSVPGDAYETLSINSDTHIKMWNSIASAYLINPTGSLYSKDHNAVDGDLYIFGAYSNIGGNEYWSYGTDFDGTDLVASSTERQVDVRFASGATATLTDSVFQIIGSGVASTTIANQGSGTYTVDVSGGTTTAQHYRFSNLGSTGLSLLGGAIVPVLRDGSYDVGTPSGTAITLSSTTIDANPAKQIYNVSFSTSTPISAFNVTQTDGTPASYWWFRQGYGNLYGEAKDDDTGDPGSVRFDDSSLVVTLSGTVYSDAGATPIIGGTCNGSTAVVRVMIDGVFSTSTSCSNVDGSFNAQGVVVIGDPTVTVYLDNASGGEKGSVITRTLTGDISNLDIYANRVIVRNEDTEPLTIANMAVFDNDNDPDVQFLASTSTVGNQLTVLAGNELFVFATSTFAPGGDVTLMANASPNSYDGTLYLDDNATFVGSGTSTYTIGGRFVLDAGAVFTPAMTTVLMNATTTGKSITSPSEITFYDLIIDGVGGGWNLGADIQVDGDMTITNGTVTGTEDITLTNGSLTGNGVLSLGGGTTTIATSTTLGGTTAWTFYNLQLGDGIFTGVTTPAFISTTTISGRLTIATAHFLDAGSTTWDLAGTGTVFVENGTFLEDTSTLRYSGAGSNVLSTQYYNLDINSGAGSHTYIATGLGLMVDGDLTIGGSASSVFDLNTNDPLLDVNGDVIIRSNGTFSASDSAVLTVAGSYDNEGVFTGNGGTIEFDGAGTVGIASGNSSFASVLVNSTGDITVTENATATSAWTLANANTFTLASGQILAVGGVFTNSLDGTDTTWTGSTLSLYGGNNYSLNNKTTSDTYGTLTIDGTTQVRMWNSSASAYDVDSTASLYSQDHDDISGDLYIWGSYRNTGTADYWNYATDFDGTNLTGGSERKVDVYFASGASASITGGSLDVNGASTSSSTIQNQGAGTYSLLVGGSASTSFRYYEIRDIDSNGLVLVGTANIHDLSDGDIEVSQNTGTGITVEDTVITNNPAKLFYNNRFALDGVATGTNVTATGSPLSSWKFQSHYGGLDGEDYDNDDGGDPGYIAWDNSTSTITVSGYVYSDEGTTPLPACVGNNDAIITLYVNGAVFDTVDCTDAGYFTFTDIVYSLNQPVIAYIDNGGADMGATVSVDLVSDVFNFNIYEDRVIARHEATDPLTNTEFAAWDSDNADIPYTADGGNLVLPANTKLLVWSNKEFAPGGNVTVSGGGAGAAYDGTLELQAGATWTGAGTELLTVGGSFTLGLGATLVASNGTTTFTTTGAGRTIDVNENSFNNVAFTGAGDWSIIDSNVTFNGNVSITAGEVTLPTGTSTFNGSFINTGGSFDANGGLARFTGASTKGVTLGGSDLATVRFQGGNYVFGDTNATTTGSTTIVSGNISLPSGTFSVGGDFRNTGGSITHNTSNLVFTNATGSSLLSTGSDLYEVTFAGGGDYIFEDNSLALLDSLTLLGGSMTLASGTLSIGGSFYATGGTFDNATGTILFNSSTGGELIDPGVSNFYNIQISAPSGGYTLLGGATTTNNFSLVSASSFTLQSGAVLNVEGVFLNTVGGTNTTWTGSTLYLNGENQYTINTKASGGDQYDILQIGANSDIRVWNSSATTTIIDASSSLYSKDNAGVDGSLYIYGDFHVSTTTEHWSYATDFDGASLSGSERAVTVNHAPNATTTVDGGVLRIIGVSGNVTTVTNQGSGTYALNVNSGTFNAQYYALRNLNASGLNLTGTPLISSLSFGDYELAVDSGTLISVSSTTLNANASLVIPGNRFATTTAITGNNVTLTGETSNAWTFTGHTGNLAGEDYDVDGVTECGSVRWSDSSCLITQQTDYRWRNDDGGLGVPNSEWYDADWDSRKRVSVTNVDPTTYSDSAVKLLVDYDADMQADFDDLRFTSGDGMTVIPHWLASSTDSVMAEVWVKVPSLPAEETSTIYMYYNNLSAVTTSSSTEVFIASDDFEIGDKSQYSGEVGQFTVGGNFAYGGSFGLDATGNETGRTALGGIYNLNQTVSVGQTIRYLQFIDPSKSDEVCVKFGIQTSGAPASNYAVCTDHNGTDRLVLVRNAVDTADISPAVTLDSYNIASSTGWHVFEIDWATSSIEVNMYNPGGALAGVASSTDSNYSTGGFGFSFWYQHGGWDNFTSRPTLATEPTIQFGLKQTDGGASWASAQNTSATFDTADVARLRISVENTGLPITNQRFLLEYAEMGASPSCQAVNSANFVSVPTQASCGTSPVCMQNSVNVTNGASTFDLLTGVRGVSVAGEARKDPTNITGNLNLDQDEFLELEYVITPTINVTDENLCFRVTDNGSDYDTYLNVAHMTLRFNPVVTTATLNEGTFISLLPGTTTRIYATASTSDANGFSDLTYATSTIYRSGVAGGASCTPDNNNCYVSSGPSCQFVNCSGNTCDVECFADIYFHADATDASPYEGEEWFAFIEVEDASGGYDFDTSLGQELVTLRAINILGQIDYGSLEVNTNTGTENASTTIINQGNVPINIQIQGVDLTDGFSSYIPSEQQKIATSTFDYSTCGAVCDAVSSTTPVQLNLDLSKPTVDNPPVVDFVYWGIAIPIGVNSAPHQGYNVFTPVSP